MRIARPAAAAIVAVAASLVYCDFHTLHGDLLYDDKASIKDNPCVRPDTDLSLLWRNQSTD